MSPRVLLLVAILLTSAAPLRAQQPTVAAKTGSSVPSTGDPDDKSGGKSSTSTNGAFKPLTAHQKLKYGFREAFLKPETYFFLAASAAITESTERRLPQKTDGDRFADGLSRFAINFGTSSAQSLLSSGVYPALFRQDPRYTPSPKKGFWNRFSYAASRVFVTRSDDGNTEPNYSLLGGAFTASALDNIWDRDTPGRRRIGVGPTFTRFGFAVGFDMLDYVFVREFLPSLKQKLRRK